MLLIALSAKNAILIVEVARERRIFDGKPIIEAALEAARARFRPILMTSFAFILGVLPLVLATGAGANSRKSIGIAVFSGMLASTCLAVLFVPSFFVVVRRFEEWRAARKGKAGVQRHARLDLPCGAVRAVVFRRRSPFRGMARRAQRQGGKGSRRPISGVEEIKQLRPLHRISS